MGYFAFSLLNNWWKMLTPMTYAFQHFYEYLSTFNYFTTNFVRQTECKWQHRLTSFIILRKRASTSSTYCWCTLTNIFSKKDLFQIWFCSDFWGFFVVQISIKFWNEVLNIPNVPSSSSSSSSSVLSSLLWCLVTPEKC